MKTYKDQAGRLHEIEPEYEALLPAGCVEITQAEADQIRAAQGAQSIEEWRNGATVSRFQARAALLLAGLLDQVQALMDNPATDPLARLAWADAQEFRRMSPTVQGMGVALGLSDVQLDDLFRQAATISA